MKRLGIGYTPKPNPSIVKGASVMQRIDYDALWLIAGGGSGVVLTDGTYAIKIGHIERYEYEQLERAAELGFAMPVLYFEESVTIDWRFVDLISSETILSAGYRGRPEDYLSANGSTYMADIMVSLYAESFIDPRTGLEDRRRARAYRIASRVAKKYLAVSGESWDDKHPWNLGVYDGGLIIFDF